MESELIIQNIKYTLTPGLYKEKERVWLVDFNGRQSTLFKSGEQWMQGADGDLTSDQVVSISEAIKNSELNQKYV